MNKQRALRIPLAAVVGILAFFVVPAAAQAHHIDATASCKLVNNVSTVEYKVTFIGFSSNAKPTTKGTVKVDNVVSTQVPPSTISWNTEPGTLSGSKAAAADQTHSVKAEFQWKVNNKWESGTVTKTTNKCPKPSTPADPAVKLVKTGASFAYAGDTVTYQFAATNTGNVTLGSVTLTDNKCQSTLVRKAGETDTTFNPGDVWNYTCTSVVPAGVTSVVNVAEICGTYTPAVRPRLNRRRSATRTTTSSRSATSRSPSTRTPSSRPRWPAPR